MIVTKKDIMETLQENDLLNNFQFGFRKHRCTTSAAALLHEIIKSRLKQKKKTYACFVDLKKRLIR